MILPEFSISDVVVVPTTSNVPSDFNAPVAVTFKPVIVPLVDSILPVDVVILPAAVV